MTEQEYKEQRAYWVNAALSSEEKADYAGITFKELLADFCWPEK